MNTVRKYYDKFLTLYPLCYGYWKKVPSFVPLFSS